MINLNGTSKTTEQGVLAFANTATLVYGHTFTPIKTTSAVRGGTTFIDDGTNVLSAGDYRRIQNAASRIKKPITVVGSRASGKAGAYSDWDYIIEGGLNSREWSKIKNSLPGARSIFDSTRRNIDILPGPVRKEYPHITIYPK